MNGTIGRLSYGRTSWAPFATGLRRVIDVGLIQRTAYIVLFRRFYLEYPVRDWQR